MAEIESHECDLAVIGTGMAGMSAALFAVNRGLSVVQTGSTGSILFASGLLDLLGVHPVETGRVWEDPWAAITRLREDAPNHPYARLTADDIRRAFREILDFLQNRGLPYVCGEERNLQTMTPMGTVKTTWCVPRSMEPGVRAMAERRPCLLADFGGLKDFSARHIQEMLRPRWPGLRSARVDFPDENYRYELMIGENTAWTMEVEENREKLAQALEPYVAGVEAVGLPAMLGMNATAEILEELGERLGVTVFEIPTMPGSVPGLRLMRAFQKGLPELGCTHFSNRRVLEAGRENGRFRLGLGVKQVDAVVKAEGVVLATGRFLGQGLKAERTGVRETVFGLPVHQPDNRSQWHREDFLDRRGHPINRAGVEIDDRFRPLDATGGPPYDTLFAAGGVLAHQDWIRQKCGSGLAIASAFGAVKAFAETV